MALRCAQCGNRASFEVRRPGILRFAVYADPRHPGEMREERLPLDWELRENGEYVCRVCGSTQVQQE
jgi:DNA-directed RNA polymerase subunit RPC12/RpoP